MKHLNQTAWNWNKALLHIVQWNSDLFARPWVVLTWPANMCLFELLNHDCQSIIRLGKFDLFDFREIHHSLRKKNKNNMTKYCISSYIIYNIIYYNTMLHDDISSICILSYVNLLLTAAWLFSQVHLANIYSVLSTNIWPSDVQVLHSAKFYTVTRKRKHLY